ncbi:MAG TPA: hypothetical protein VJM34_05780 [Novosphingobium sp.]|nr:hypothetical protein [Novosphingobium sp.]
MEDEPRGRNDKIVAVGLLPKSEMRNFGTRLKQIYSVTDDGSFDSLLQHLAIACRRDKPPLR